MKSQKLTRRKLGQKIWWMKKLINQHRLSWNIGILSGARSRSNSPHCSETIFNPNVEELTVFFILSFFIYIWIISLHFKNISLRAEWKNARFVRSNGWKPLSSGQKWFLRWVFPGFGGYFGGVCFPEFFDSVIRSAVSEISQLARFYEKLKKMVFFWFSSNYLRFWYRNTYPGYHHVKANVLTIPKMWWFLGLRVFERELSLLKVGRPPKFWVRYHK